MAALPNFHVTASENLIVHVIVIILAIHQNPLTYFLHPVQATTSKPRDALFRKVIKERISQHEVVSISSNPASVFALDVSDVVFATVCCDIPHIEESRCVSLVLDSLFVDLSVVLHEAFAGLWTDAFGGTCGV